VSEPASSVVLCELDAERRTRLRRPDREALEAWKDDYRGLGSLRSEGYEDSVFSPPELPPDEEAVTGE
jgi:hypothetical protein